MQSRVREFIDDGSRMKFFEQKAVFIRQQHSLGIAHTSLDCPEMNQITPVTKGHRLCQQRQLCAEGFPLLDVHLYHVCTCLLLIGGALSRRRFNVSGIRYNSADLDWCWVIIIHPEVQRVFYFGRLLVQNFRLAHAHMQTSDRCIVFLLDCTLWHVLGLHNTIVTQKGPF